MRILLLEDDPLLSEILSEHLSLRFDVTSVCDGLEAFEAIETHPYDLLLLDVDVPNLSGFELLKLLRDSHITTPTMFITSHNQPNQLKLGFELGADDYLKKPFDTIELDARIDNIIKLRKLNLINHKIGNWVLNPESHTLDCEGEHHKLSKKETQILLFLLKSPNTIVPHHELIANIWINENIPNDATLRTYIKNLRAILGKASIESIKGVGYVLHPE